jgi:plasmid stabilization system protein ParE
MITIQFHPEAERELLEARTWYRERSEVASQAFILQIDRALAAIAAAPDRWPPRQRNERRVVLPRFPYSILYRIRNDEIFIVAVAHDRRRPGYWRHRA